MAIEKMSLFIYGGIGDALIQEHKMAVDSTISPLCLTYITLVGIHVFWGDNSFNMVIQNNSTVYYLIPPYFIPKSGGQIEFHDFSCLHLLLSVA